MTVSGDDASLGHAEALLLETYGLRLLAFLCGTDRDVIRARLEGSARLSEAPETVLMDSLLPIAQHVATQFTGPQQFPRSLSLQVLASPSADGSSLGIALRRAAGGTLPDDLVELAGDDQVKMVLARMAIDLYPLLLAPVDPIFRRPHISLYQHPLRETLQAAVQADDALGRLFTEEDPGLGKRGYVHTSLGRGGSFQDVMFGEVAIGSAWDTATMIDDDVDLGNFVEQLMRNVDALRDAASGRQVSVPALVVFTGFTTEGNRSIETPWGLLRPLLPWERELAPSTLQGAVSGADPAGRQVTVAFAGEMVLETTVPYSMIISRMPDDIGVPPQWPTMRGWEDVRRKLESIQLATILGTDRPPGSWVTNAKPSGSRLPRSDCPAVSGDRRSRQVSMAASPPSGTSPVW